MSTITIKARRADRVITLTRENPEAVESTVSRLVELGWAIQAIRIEPINVIEVPR